MATKPLTSEAIALAEKKMNMTLDDIIKMSKTNASKPKKQRILNKSKKLFSGNQYKTQKMQQYLNSRSTLRQGVLSQKRSNFPVSGFPLASEAAARKASGIPQHYRPFTNNSATKWNQPRPSGALKQQRNRSNGGNVFKAPKSGEALPSSRPKTLDSLFANMKEQRMRSFTANKNAASSQGGSVGVGVRNQVRQPWLRRRFGY